MDIQELDKKQLILLTLLITFVVSIGTGIVTVSLMKQVPQTVPQTINNVIQRTIEKVSTVEVPTTTSTTSNTSSSNEENLSLLSSNSDALIFIYRENADLSSLDEKELADKAIGSGVIISEAGLVLVNSNILINGDTYKVLLDKTEFNASLLKEFDNGFSVLRISPITATPDTSGTNTSGDTQSTPDTTGGNTVQE